MAKRDAQPVPGRQRAGKGELRLVVEPHAPEGMRQIVRDHLDTYNVAVTGLSDYSQVSIFLKDGHNEIMGGLLGAIWGSWLHVAFLWVAESFRGRGHGQALLEAAETLARDRGCTDVHLSSFSFQAPGFYQKLGYEVFGQLDDHPVGHTHYFLRKRLRAGTHVASR